ncbi:MAG: hypothetical protein J7574_16965 [Flavobacterium sp.]|uniref:hypothetical protein n=1 Tax=Flavobacterium sp. TaxID=239 RepID=UPI001B0290B9|nr:hypothetical protein [Flavobacterium sp.]MBO9585858.1 hypothetical protein [Flavobacterium sp.]
MKSALTINLSQETVEILNQGNFTLCCFIASKSDNALSCSPLCWNTISKNFLKSILIQWEFNLSAYLSTSPISDNAVIYIPQPLSSLSKQSARYTVKKNVSGSNDEIELKQRMLIENFGKITIDTNNASPNVLIQNNSTDSYSTGICVYSSDDSQYYGTCAFSIYNGNTISVSPLNKIFVMFTTKNIQNNTVISKSENQGLLIDFSGSSDNSRTVSYDIRLGWNSNNQPWGTKIPVGTLLNTILVS